MSLTVSNIRLPFDLPEEQALAEARRLTGLASDEVQAAASAHSAAGIRRFFMRSWYLGLVSGCAS